MTSIAVEVGGWEVPPNQLMREPLKPVPLGAVVEPNGEAIDAGWVPGTMPDILIGTADSSIMGTIIAQSVNRQVAADRRRSRVGGEVKLPKHKRPVKPKPVFVEEVFAKAEEIKAKETSGPKVPQPDIEPASLSIVGPEDVSGSPRRERSPRFVGREVLIETVDSLGMVTGTSDEAVQEFPDGAVPAGFHVEPWTPGGPEPVGLDAKRLERSHLLGQLVGINAEFDARAIEVDQ